MTEDEMVGQHYRLNGHEFEKTLGDVERQGSLACCSPWGCKESDMTERLNNEQQQGLGAPTTHLLLDRHVHTATPTPSLTTMPAKHPAPGCDHHQMPP